jgi:hypothetical protein
MRGSSAVLRRGRGLSALQSSIGRSGRFRSPYALEFRQRPRNTLGFGPRTRKRPTRSDGRCGHSRRMRRQVMDLRQRSRELIQKWRLWRGSIWTWKPLLNRGLGTLELLYWAYFARQGARGKSGGPTAGTEVVQFLPKTLDPSMFAFEPSFKSRIQVHDSFQHRNDCLNIQIVASETDSSVIQHFNRRIDWKRARRSRQLSKASAIHL